MFQAATVVTLKAEGTPLTAQFTITSSETNRVVYPLLNKVAVSPIVVDNGLEVRVSPLFLQAFIFVINNVENDFPALCTWLPSDIVHETEEKTLRAIWLDACRLRGVAKVKSLHERAAILYNTHREDLEVAARKLVAERGITIGTAASWMHSFVVQEQSHHPRS